MLAVNVLTWHNDLTRQGLNSAETALTPANVNSSTFGKLFTYPVAQPVAGGGQIYAEPLYVSNLAIPGQGTHNVVFVATENNDVYAFDADSNAGANGGVLWHVNLGPAAAMPNAFFGNRYGPYHDIKPSGRHHQHAGDRSGHEHDVPRLVHQRRGRAKRLFASHLGARHHDRPAKDAPALVAASVQGNGR